MNVPIDQQIDLLRCIACDGDSLQIADRPAEAWSEMRLPVGDQCLKCSGCQAMYPLTDCGIPVLWNEQLKSYLQKQETHASPLSANVEIYNATSTEYQDYHRKYPKTAARIHDAVKKFLADDGQDAGRTKRHLDFGCGPGHVLSWLKDLGMEQYGLDISIENLRNARAQTGAFVVLGSADDMPFRTDKFDVVTESSVLHHIENWKDTLREASRVCAPGGAVLLDSEPSTETKDWSLAARLLFQCRWYPYKIMSYFSKDKFWFRDLEQAKLNYFLAEIHNQPGKGFPLDELKQTFNDSGLTPTVYLNPGEVMEKSELLSLKSVILHTLSFHNPFSPRYGMFSAVATKP